MQSDSRALCCESFNCRSKWKCFTVSILDWMYNAFFHVGPRFLIYVCFTDVMKTCCTLPKYRTLQMTCACYGFTLSSSKISPLQQHWIYWSIYLFWGILRKKVHFALCCFANKSQNEEKWSRCSTYFNFLVISKCQNYCFQSLSSSTPFRYFKCLFLSFQKKLHSHVQILRSYREDRLGLFILSYFDFLQYE